MNNPKPPEAEYVTDHVQKQLQSNIHELIQQVAARAAAQSRTIGFQQQELEHQRAQIQGYSNEIVELRKIVFPNTSDDIQHANTTAEAILNTARALKQAKLDLAKSQDERNGLRDLVKKQKAKIQALTIELIHANDDRSVLRNAVEKLEAELHVKRLQLKKFNRK